MRPSSRQTLTLVIKLISYITSIFENLLGINFKRPVSPLTILVHTIIMVIYLRTIVVIIIIIICGYKVAFLRQTFDKKMCVL